MIKRQVFRACFTWVGAPWNQENSKGKTRTANPSSWTLWSGLASGWWAPGGPATQMSTLHGLRGPWWEGGSVLGGSNAHWDLLLQGVDSYSCQYSWWLHGGRVPGGSGLGGALPSLLTCLSSLIFHLLPCFPLPDPIDAELDAGLPSPWPPTAIVNSFGHLALWELKLGL